jgi:SSS family solute:Na+ symporter
MDIAVILLYLLVLVFIGSRSFQMVKGINGFFVADRSAPFAFVTGSLFATIIGGSATIGMAGLGYTQGLVGSWWLLVGAIGLFVLGLFWAERVRAYALYTLPEILEVQYGPEAKLLASVLIVIAWMGIIAGQIVAAGRILEVIWSAPAPVLMLITGGVFILYTLLGGQYSVVRTDTIQSLIIVVAILVAIPLCLGKVGGVLSMREALGHDYFSFPVSQQFTGRTLATYLFLVGSTYVVGPDVYSRLFCAGGRKVARGATMTVALALIPFAFSITMVGMSARVLFPGISPEASFPTMITHVFPMGVSGLVIAALLSAVMSSADTCLLTTSTILSVDVIRAFLRPAISERSLLVLSRFLIVVIGVFSLFLALRLKGVIPSLLLGYTVYTSGLVFPVLLGFYRDRLGVRREGAILAMLAGGGLALTGKLMGLRDFGLYGFFLSGAILIIGSWVVALVKGRD